MNLSAVIKRLLITASVAGFMSFSSTVAKAAILTVDDSGSWATGSNTLTNLGYKMMTVPNSPVAERSFFSILSSPLGNLIFDPEVSKRIVGSSWATWSHGYRGEVYFSGINVRTTTITLPVGISAFDLYVEPGNFDIFEIAVTAMDGTTTTLSQAVRGRAGAKYFGFYATADDLIATISVTDKTGTAGGFAIGELRLARKNPVSVPIPESTSVFGLLIFGGMGVGSQLRRKN